MNRFVVWTSLVLSQALVVEPSNLRYKRKTKPLFRREDRFCPVGKRRRFTPKRYPVYDPNVFSEASYMAYSQQVYKGGSVIWIGSDGSNNSISAISLKTGQTIQTYFLDIAQDKNDDWETMALGPCSSFQPGKNCLYIGNLGNNKASYCTSQKCLKGRDEVKVYKFEEPDLSPVDKEISVVTLKLNYHNKALPTNRANSEAMFVDHTGDTRGGKPGDIYIITKHFQLSSVTKVPAQIHEKAKPNSIIGYSLNPAGQISILNKEWTGADMRPDGNLISIRSLHSVYFFSRPLSMTVTDALEREACYFSLRSRKSATEFKFESIALMGNNVAEASECKRCTASGSIYVYRLRYKL